MSRYSIAAYDTRYHVVVGWDAPLATFFGEVWDRTVPDEHDEAACLLWAGAALRALPTVDALQACLQAYATIPAAIRTQLHQDRTTSRPRSPLQARLLQMMAPDRVEKESVWTLWNRIPERRIPPTNGAGAVGPPCGGWTLRRPVAGRSTAPPVSTSS